MATMVNDALVALGVAPKPTLPPARVSLAIRSHALPVAHRGKRYQALLRATGGAAPYRWSRTAGSVAPGLRLRPNGRLEGVPTRVGTYRLTARVVDRQRVARTRTFVLRVV